MTVIHKWPVQCGHCEKFLGFQLHAAPLPDVFCYGCESAVTHKEEMKAEETERYRAASARR
jgi:hypothetical protein